MALTTLQAVNDALPGQEGRVIKSLATLGSRWMTFFGVAGSPPAAANPSSGMAGAVVTKATTGAVPFANPASGYGYLGGARFVGGATTVAGLSIAIYDRLWQQSGIVVTTTGAQTINSVALDRPDANGDAAELWFEIYATTGAGAATPTVSYTNPANTSGQTATCVAYAASAAARSTFPFALASGDTGVKSVQSITLGTSLTSGTVGLVLRRKLAMVSLAPNTPVSLDALAVGLPRIYDDACLEFLVMPSSSPTLSVSGSIQIIQG